MPNKLHLASTLGGPLCGRHLSGHRLQRAQLQDTMIAAGDSASYMAALFPTAGKRPAACRHCARVAGILPPVRRRATPVEGEDNDDNCPVCGEQRCDCAPTFDDEESES